MSRRRPYRALGMFTFVAFVSSATPVTADQYFGENPLLFTSYATFFGVFMQHSGSELAREGLHKGIDILGRSDVGEQVFSANTNVVQVVWEDETEGQLMFARIDDCMNMEAFLVAHLDPGTIPLEMDPGYNFSSSRFVGRLDTRLPYYPHLHAEIYKNFPLGEIWSHCWSARWPPWDINPPGNDELKEWLVNPVLYAFEYAQWRMDDCEHCSPVISNGPEVMRESDTYFVYFTAYDVNNSTYYDAYDTQCKPGIYEASLYVDSGSDAVDQFHFTRFRDEQNAYPPLAGQFYWDPWDPPGGCNRYDELEYFLFWQNPDWPDTGHHEFRVVVRDAYGNSAEGDVMYGTVVPEVRMDCELRDGKVYIRWHLEGTSPSLGELTLHRSADARTLGCKLNPCPIHTQDESHQPIEDFVFVDDVPVYWDTLWYTLTAVVGGQDLQAIGHTWLVNPRAGEIVLRAWPNPFNPTVQIEFYNPVKGAVDVSLYDIRGRRVKQILTRDLPQGPARLSWDGKTESGQSAPPGVYFLTVRSGRAKAVEKITLVQ